MYFRRDNYSSVAIKDGGMVLSLIVIWHAVRQDIAIYVSKSATKFFRIESITISKAVSTFSIFPMFPRFEILDV